MPVGPTDGSVHASVKIRVDDLKAAGQAIRAIGKRAPTDFDRAANPIVQIAFNPFAAQRNRQEPKGGNNGDTDGQIAIQHEFDGHR